MKSSASRVGWLMLLFAAACGGGGNGAAGGGAPQATSPAGSASASLSSATAAPSSSTGGSQASAPSPDAGPKPKEKPFAKSQIEALSLIDDAINERQSEVFACVAAARERRKDPHAEIAVDLGIDQEGTLIGAKTPKGSTPDNAFGTCMVDALKGANFPRSNAGVITVSKRFTDKAVYK